MVFFLRNALNSALGDPLEAQKSGDDTQSSPSDSPSASSIATARTIRQFSLVLAGTAFVGLSTLVTKRALVRRYKAVLPKFYQPNNRPTPVNGGFEAFEALSLATINVFSWGVLMTGGTLWALDISSMEDLRTKFREKMGIDAGGKAKQDADEEMEEWLATVLARKEVKALMRKAGADLKESNDDAEAQEAAQKTAQESNDREAPR